MSYMQKYDEAVDNTKDSFKEDDAFVHSLLHVVKVSISYRDQTPPLGDYKGSTPISHD